MLTWQGETWIVAEVQHRSFLRWHWRAFVLETVCGCVRERVSEHTFRKILFDAGILTSINAAIPKVDAA